VLPTESKSVGALKKWVMIQESYGFGNNNNNYYYYYYYFYYWVLINEHQAGGTF
jgi:hypothetical protein